MAAYLQRKASAIHSNTERIVRGIEAAKHCAGAGEVTLFALINTKIIKEAL